jgi:TolA-binding protein
MLQSIGRFVMGLLLGILIGAGGVWWLMSSGAADFMLRTSHYVQDLERRVQEFGDQRAQLARQLEDMEGRLGKMADGYEALERRFKSLAETNPPADSPKAAPTPTPPSATTPPATANGAQPGGL